jgi:cytochrome b561
MNEAAAAWRNDSQRWGRVARVLHWTVAALVIAQLAFGMRFARLDMYQSTDVAWYREWIGTHKSLGLTILLFVLARLAWRLSNPTPSSAETPVWQRAAARLNHLLLYALLIVQPILGLAQSSAYGATTRFWNLFAIPSIVPLAWSRPATDIVRKTTQDMHAVTARVLLLLIAIHVLAALYHQFARRDGVLMRMVSGSPLRN